MEVIAEIEALDKEEEELRKAKEVKVSKHDRLKKKNENR
jgi:hypothetical protein